MGRQLTKDKAAENDLIDIWLFSAEQWGVAQADAYLDRIDHHIRELLAHPSVGRSRNELRLGIRSHPVGRHLVFYSFDDDELRIWRVLHGRMDPDWYLPIQ